MGVRCKAEDNRGCLQVKVGGKMARYPCMTHCHGSSNCRAAGACGAQHSGLQLTCLLTPHQWQLHGIWSFM
jgi:hypothetical protein